MNRLVSFLKIIKEDKDAKCPVCNGQYSVKITVAKVGTACRVKLVQRAVSYVCGDFVYVYCAQFYIYHEFKL